MRWHRPFGLDANYASSTFGEIAAGKPYGGIKIAPYPGHPGRKRFVASLEERDNGSKFDFKMIGFGFFAQGFGYYAAISTHALLAHIVLKRQSPEFRQALGHAAALCGQAWLSRSITLGNHYDVAERVIATVCGVPA